MDILITEDLESPCIEALAARHPTRRIKDLWKDREALQAEVKEARSLIIRNQTKITAEVLASAPQLVAIGRVGVGLDNIDIQAATAAGVVVIAPLNANAVSVAELAMGLIIALARKIPLADRSTKAGAWDRKLCTGMELEGKTLTICGMGRIGKLVAARARAFGMRIHVFDPFLRADSPVLAELQAQWFENLPQAVAAADFISVHTPLSSETRHLFNDQIFAATKPGAYFINTSRGGVMDERALLKALESGHLGGAALDVREVEPPTASAPALQRDNVILTPHIGAFSHEAQTRTFAAVCDDIENVLSGRAAVNFVNLAVPRKSVQ